MSKVLLMHPRTKDWLLREMSKEHPVITTLSPGTPPLDRPTIRASMMVDEFAKKWQFPDDPHVQYEASDEHWCRYFGIGREVIDTNSRLIMAMNEPERPATLGMRPFSPPTELDEYRRFINPGFIHRGIVNVTS